MRTTMKFCSGMCVMTRGIAALQADFGGEIRSSLFRHFSADWGDVDAEDRRANNAALVHGSRLLSVFHLSDGTRIWIITEAEDGLGRRYATTVLLPEEY